MDLPLVDGVLLVDLWPELDLPDPVRSAWQSLIDAALQGQTDDPIRVSFDDTQKQRAEEQQERIAAIREEARRRREERG